MIFPYKFLETHW